MILRNELINIYKASKQESQNQDFRQNKDKIGEYYFNELKSWLPLSKKKGDSAFQVLDFFSGCGGMSLGFNSISRDIPFFEIIGGIDINPDAAKTFEINFGVPGLVDDIVEISKNKNNLKKLLKKLPLYDKSKPLIIIGCAPCQGFTSHRKKNWNFSDERNTLIGKFSKIAIELNPACVIMENVPELLSSKYLEHLQEFKDIFTKNGYFVKQTIVNAAAYGTPQQRFRAIVIAMKHNFKLPSPLIQERSNFVTVREAIGHLPPLSPLKPSTVDTLHKCANHRESTLTVIRQIPVNGGSRPKGVGPKCLDRVKGFSDVYGRLSWDKPSITITRYARNPASGRFIHPEQDRGLSMREASILQGFPLNFRFFGNFDSIFKQIGEAVPPTLSTALAVNVLIELTSVSLKENFIDFKTSVDPAGEAYSSVMAGIKNRRISF